MKDKKLSRLFKIITACLLLAVILIMVIVLAHQHQEAKQQQEMRIEEARKKANALPHFKKMTEDDEDGGRNYNVSDNTAISKISPALKFVLSSMTKTNVVSRQQINQDQLTADDQNKVNQYFRDFSCYQSIVMMVNYSTLDGKDVNSNSQQIKVPKVGTKYYLDKNQAQQTSTDDNTYIYDDTLTFNAKGFAKKTVKMIITVDRQTGLITDVEAEK